MHEIIRKNPRLKVLLREITPFIVNHIDMALYDFSRYSLHSTLALIDAESSVLPILERNTRKSDLVLAIRNELFFIVFTKTGLPDGKKAMAKLLRKIASAPSENRIRAAALFGIGMCANPPEPPDIVEKLVVGLARSQMEKIVPFDATRC